MRRLPTPPLVLVLLVVALLGFSPAFVAAAPSTATPVTDEQTTTLDHITQEVVRLRDLPLKRDVPETFLTRDELRHELESTLDEDYPAADAKADARALTAFGLIPSGTDLRQVVLDLEVIGVAGYYDPATNEMSLVGATKTLDAQLELTYAHEMTHALQDQDLGLDGLDQRLETANDDAMTVEDAYLRSNPDLADRLQDEAGPLEWDPAILKAVPPIVIGTLVFPYNHGPVFIDALRQGDDWAAVDTAYRDPPTTTEQVLHPEKYLQRDEPTAIKLPDLTKALGAGWHQLEENVFGEYQTALMLPRTPAAGWDGDRYALWVKDAQNVVVWESAWDSRHDAEEFTSALRKYDEIRFHAAYQDGATGTATLTTDTQIALIEQTDTRVRYVLAPTTALAQAAMTATEGG